MSANVIVFKRSLIRFIEDSKLVGLKLISMESPWNWNKTTLICTPSETPYTSFIRNLLTDDAESKHNNDKLELSSATTEVIPLLHTVVTVTLEFLTTYYTHQSQRIIPTKRIFSSTQTITLPVSSTMVHYYATSSFPLCQL